MYVCVRKHTFFSIGNQFKICFATETDNYEKVEDLFKKNIIAKGLNVKLQFGGKQRIELFTTSDDFSLDDAINLMKELAENNQLESTKNLKGEIKKLKYKQDNDILIEKEKTKQEEEKTKQEIEKTKQEETKYKAEQEKEKTKQLELQLKILEAQKIKCITKKK